MKKKIVALAAMILVPTLVFAGAVAEGMGAGMLAGGGLGYLFGGPVGLAAGLIFGAGAGMVGGGIMEAERGDDEEERDTKEDQDVYDKALAEVNSLETDIANTQLSLDQANADISTFDEAIGRLQGQYDMQKEQMQVQGQQIYTDLLNNWQGTEIMAAMKDQTGGTADLLAQQEKNKLERFVGKDLLFDENGGMYGSQLKEFNLDMRANRDNLYSQRDITIKSKGILENSLNDLNTSLATAKKTRDDAKNRLRK